MSAVPFTPWHREIAAGMAGATKLEAEPLRPFRVQIKSGQSVIMDFEAMGSDSVTVAHQHQALCGPGQYVRCTRIYPEAELAEADLQLAQNKAQRAHARNDAAAMELQVQAWRSNGGM